MIWTSLRMVSSHLTAWGDIDEIAEEAGELAEEGAKIIELYDHRKEIIERLFDNEKEFHGFRYTNVIDKARMNMKVGLTFVCLNLKKLATMMWKKNRGSSVFTYFGRFLSHFYVNSPVLKNILQKTTKRLCAFDYKSALPSSRPLAKRAV